jgi:hypothetical protein
VDTAALSVIFTGTVGIGGLLVGAWGTRATVRAHAAEGAAAREHERLLARDERFFERRADAYEAVVRECEIYMAYVESKYPIIAPGQPEPVIPSVEDQLANQGRFSTYASPEADEALASFLKKTWEFEIIAKLYGLVKDQGQPPGKEFVEMNEAREKARDLFAELKAIIRAELAAA